MTDDGDGVALLQRARRALLDDARRERRGRALAVVGALLMSALALLISWRGAQWQAELIVTDARAQRAEVATVELQDANRRLAALGLPQIVLPPGAQADELFLAALRGQTAADRAEERRALGQPIDPGPDPLVPPPALTGPSAAAPGDTTGPTSPSIGSAPPTATGPPAPPSDTESSAPPAPTATPGTDTGTAPSPGPTTSTEAPPTDVEPPASSVPEPGPAPEPPPQDPPPGGGLLPLLPGLRLPGIAPLL